MTIYSPILKDSPAEIRAVKEFYNEFPNNKNMIPIIECPIFPDIKNFPQKRNTLGSYLNKRIGTHRFIFSIVSSVKQIKNPKNYEAKIKKNIIQFLNDKLIQNNANFIFMVSYDSPDWILDELIKLNNIEELWISFLPYSYNFENFDSEIDDKLIDSTITRFKTFFPNTKLKLNVNFYNQINDINRIKHFIEKLYKESNIVMLTLTSCPENALKAPHSSITPIGDRTDFYIFKKMQIIFSNLIFSDYTVRLMPEPSDKIKHDINIYNTYFKIFYTTSNKYYIIKAGLNSKVNDPNNTDHKDLKEVCSTFIKQKIYDGKNFSWGDSQIQQIANGNINIRGHRKPISIAINHHLVKTISQL